jgi:hypothetical protein
MHVMNRIGLIFCAVLFLIFFAQEYSMGLPKMEKIKVDNIRHKIVDGDIVIIYDLNGPADYEYTLKLTMKRKSNGVFQYKPRNLSGDIGKGFFSGKDRQIVWKISKEFPSGFFNEDFYFEVNVDQISQNSGSNTLLWIGAGAVVIGGGVAAYYLWLKPKKTESFPDPPNTRPY